MCDMIMKYPKSLWQDFNAFTKADSQPSCHFPPPLPFPIAPAQLSDHQVQSQGDDSDQEDVNPQAKLSPTLCFEATSKELERLNSLLQAFGGLGRSTCSSFTHTATQAAFLTLAPK